MSVARAKVSESGRLSIPAEMRKALGLDRGGDVVVELRDNELRVRTIAEEIARVQALARKLLVGKPGVSVEDFLRDRREEAERE